jgi:cell division septum initiation protein DivIVA
MNPADIAKQIEDLKLQLATAEAEANRTLRAEAIKAAQAKGDMFVAECKKAGDNLVAAALTKAEAMLNDAKAKAATMLKRAEEGKAFDAPANPSRLRKGRQLPDGRVIPLGRGKPSPTWVVVDLDTVDPSLIVRPETSALGTAVALANSQADNHGGARPVVAQADTGAVEFTPVNRNIAQGA